MSHYTYLNPPKEWVEENLDKQEYVSEQDAKDKEAVLKEKLCAIVAYAPKSLDESKQAIDDINSIFNGFLSIMKAEMRSIDKDRWKENKYLWYNGWQNAFHDRYEAEDKVKEFKDYFGREKRKLIALASMDKSKIKLDKDKYDSIEDYISWKVDECFRDIDEAYGFDAYSAKNIYDLWDYIDPESFKN